VSGALAPGITGKEFHGDRMDAAIGNLVTQQGVDLLLALDRAQGRQRITDEQQLKISAFTLDHYFSVGEL